MVGGSEYIRPDEIYMPETPFPNTLLSSTPITYTIQSDPHFPQHDQMVKSSSSQFFVCGYGEWGCIVRIGLGTGQCPGDLPDAFHGSKSKYEDAVIVVSDGSAYGLHMSVVWS